MILFYRLKMHTRDYKVGDRKVLVVEDVAYKACAWSAGPRIIYIEDDGYFIRLDCEENEKFSKGELIAAECISADRESSLWKRIADA